MSTSILTFDDQAENQEENLMFYFYSSNKNAEITETAIASDCQ